MYIRIRKNLLPLAIVSAMMVPASGYAEDMGQIRWFGSVYAKFLDGNRRLENGLYGNSENGNGDQGQGIEFELMFENQVSKQAEVGGRLKGRFNKNYWSNFGGFGDQENDPASAQYLKVRGVWARLTPGYEWVDSVHIGSHDFGLFDAFTMGKYRYIDRDNGSGVILQGSALDKRLRWDVARQSLPRLFAGPRFRTDNDNEFALQAQDSAWATQVKYALSQDLNLGAIFEYIDDNEVSSSENDTRDGQTTTSRYTNRVLGLKADYSGAGMMDIRGAVYYSDFNIANDTCDGTLNGNCRFSPTIQDDANGNAIIVDFDFNETFAEDLTFNMQLFKLGADFQSVLATRRETDVLLTEGREGSWGWSRPDYNFGNRGNGNSQAGIGYGGWNGTAHQVASLMADNDFTDFDETMAESVVGWQGVTIVPKWLSGDWEWSAEYSYIDFDTNWQACGEATKSDCIYNRQDGIHSWGLGGDYRSPYAPYQEKTMQIFALHTAKTLNVGKGIDFTARFKYIRDEDDRVTEASNLADAYDGYPDAAGFALNPDWEALTPAQRAVTSVSNDDRKADYYTLGFSTGYQLSRDLYGRILYQYQTVDLVDGTTNVAPVGMGFEASNDFGYAEYLSGDHEKHTLVFQLAYFLSGVEIGADIQWIKGTYDPSFAAGAGQSVPFTADGSAVITPVGNISTDKVDLKQYRMKTFVKVKF